MEALPLRPVVLTRRFTIQPQQRVATAGSRFAQHDTAIRPRAGRSNFRVAREPGEACQRSNARRASYGVFSCPLWEHLHLRQLLKLFQACFEGRTHRGRGCVLRDDGRHVDAVAPADRTRRIRYCGRCAATGGAPAAVKRMFRDQVRVHARPPLKPWRSRLDGTASLGAGVWPAGATRP